MAKGHVYGISLLLFGLAIFFISVYFQLGPISGYLFGSVGLLVSAGGLTLVMNEEGVDPKFIASMWAVVLTIIGLILGVKFYIAPS